MRKTKKTKRVKALSTFTRSAALEAEHNSCDQQKAKNYLVDAEVDSNLNPYKLPLEIHVSESK